MQCSVCGAMVPEGQLYCAVCGAPIQPQPQQPQQTQGPQQPQQFQQVPQWSQQFSQPPQQSPQQPPQAQFTQPAPQQPQFRMTMHSESAGRGARYGWGDLNRAAIFAALLAVAAAIAFTLVTLLLELVPFSSLASSMQSGGMGSGGLGSGGLGSGGLDDSSGLSDMLQNAIDSLKPGMFTMFALALGLGIGGSVHCDLTMEAGSGLQMFLSDSGDSPMVSYEATLRGGIGIAGVAMLLGAAFGAYIIAKSGALRRVKRSALYGGIQTAIWASAIISVLLAVGRHDESASLLVITLMSHYSAFTYITVFMAWILPGVGAAIGISLGNRASGAPSVFHAAWRWMHRQSGYVRTVVETLVFGSGLFAVAAFVYSLLLCYSMSDYAGANMDASNQTAQWLASNPVKMWVGMIPLLPELALYLFMLCCFGTYKLHPLGQSDVGDGSQPANGELHDLFTGAWLGSFPTMSCAWFKWVVFAAFVILTLYLALRAGKRYRADVQSGEWSHVWKAPVAMLLLAAALQFGFMVLSLRLHISGTGGDGFFLDAEAGNSANMGGAIAPMPWCFLLPGVWMLLVEALARVIGVKLAQRVPVGDGGCIYPEAPGTPFAGLPRAHEPADLPEGFDAQHVDESWYETKLAYSPRVDLAGGMVPVGGAVPYPGPSYPQPGSQSGYQPQGYYQSQQGYQPQGYQAAEYQPQGYQAPVYQSAEYQPQGNQDGYQPQGYQSQDYQAPDYQPQGNQAQGYQDGYQPQEYQPQEYQPASYIADASTLDPYAYTPDDPATPAVDGSPAAGDQYSGYGQQATADWQDPTAPQNPTPAPQSHESAYSHQYEHKNGDR